MTRRKKGGEKSENLPRFASYTPYYTLIMRDEHRCP